MSDSLSCDTQPGIRLAVPLVVRDRSVTVSISGDLTADTASLVRLHLLSLACEDGPAEIVLDLSGVTWIDAAGAEALLEANHRQLLRASALRVDKAPLARLIRNDAPADDSLFPGVAPLTRLRSLMDLNPSASAEPAVPEVSAGSAASGAEQATIEQLQTEVEQLKQALAARDLIGQGKGVISVLYGCDQAAAFAVLKRLSMNTNRKLQDVCALLVCSAARQGQLPNDLAHQLRADRPGGESRAQRRPAPNRETGTVRDPVAGRPGRGSA